MLLDWTKAGTKINGKYLSHLRFADAIILFCNSAKDLQTRIEELNESSKMSRLKMNLKKTQVMFNNYINSCSIKADNNELEIVDNYIYL